MDGRAGGHITEVMDGLSTEVSNIIRRVAESHSTMPKVSRFFGIIIPISQDDRAT